MKDQVEYRRPDLFRTTHTYLDSNLAINSAVDLARASVRAEGEHHSFIPSNADSHLVVTCNKPSARWRGGDQSRELTSIDVLLSRR